jgi:hypothetical protein
LNENLTNFYSEGYEVIKLTNFGLAKAYNNIFIVKNAKDPHKRLWFPFPIFENDFGVPCSEILSKKKLYAFEPKTTLQTKIAKGKLKSTISKN